MKQLEPSHADIRARATEEVDIVARAYGDRRPWEWTGGAPARVWPEDADEIFDIAKLAAPFDDAPDDLELVLHLRAPTYNHDARDRAYAVKAAWEAMGRAVGVENLESGDSAVITTWTDTRDISLEFIMVAEPGWSDGALFVRVPRP